MSAGDVYLKIVADDLGRPVLHLHGRKFGVLEEPRIEQNTYPVGVLGRQRADYELRIRAFLLEPDPEPPKLKRRISTHLGLRKP